MTRLTPRAAVVLACGALAAGALAGCGDADDPAHAAAAAGTLKQTLAATTSLDSARLQASLQLAPDGRVALGGPISLRAAGPFAAGERGELPRFDLRLAGVLARTNLRARAISTGERMYLRIDGRDYELAGIARHKRSRERAHGGLAGLGLNPAAWVAAPRAGGTATIGGVQTTRVTGTVDVRRLLDDVARLLGGGADGLLGPRVRAAIVEAVRSSTVELWTGASDRILRQLVASVDFAFKRGASPIEGLDGGKVTLRLRLDDVNATDVDPKAPAGARPLSDLLGEGGLGALLQGLGAGAPGGDQAQALLRCLRSSTSTADVAACTSKLAP